MDHGQGAVDHVGELGVGEGHEEGGDHAEVQDVGGHRHHRNAVCLTRIRVFVLATRLPGPLCSKHSGSACIGPTNRLFFFVLREGTFVGNADDLFVSETGGACRRRDLRFGESADETQRLDRRFAEPQAPILGSGMPGRFARGAGAMPLCAL